MLACVRCHGVLERREVCSRVDVIFGSLIYSATRRRMVEEKSEKC